MRYQGKKICPDERTNEWTDERGGWAAEDNAFDTTVGWRRHENCWQNSMICTCRWLSKNNCRLLELVAIDTEPLPDAFCLCRVASQSGRLNVECVCWTCAVCSCECGWSKADSCRETTSARSVDCRFVDSWNRPTSVRQPTRPSGTNHSSSRSTCPLPRLSTTSSCLRFFDI